MCLLTHLKFDEIKNGTHKRKIATLRQIIRTYDNKLDIIRVLF